MTISSTPSDPLVVIVGATGKQGGSVLKNLTESDKPYRIRALSRDKSKASAKAIAATGVEVVQADVRPENHDDVVKAFTGADVVFGVTNFWEYLDADREEAEGKGMIDAAVEAGVKLFIYSGLPSPAKQSGGKHTKVLHYESKAAVDDYGRSLRSSAFAFQSVHAAHYHDMFQVVGGLNFFQKWAVKDDVWFLRNKQKEGTALIARLPVPLDLIKTKPIPIVDTANDYGLWVRAVIENTEMQGDSRPVMASGSEMNLTEITDILARVTGSSFRLETTSKQDYIARMPAEASDAVKEDPVDLWAYIFDFGYYGGETIHWADPYLARKPITFAEWAEQADLSALK